MDDLGLSRRLALSSNSTRLAGRTRSSSSVRNTKRRVAGRDLDPHVAATASFTAIPLTRVPLRLSRSLIWNRPSSSRRSRQCFRETDGSTTATTLCGSRPSVASPSGNGMVASLEGPAITRSLGRNQVSQLRCRFLITARAQMHDPTHLISNIRTVSQPIRSDSFFAACPPKQPVSAQQSRNSSKSLQHDCLGTCRRSYGDARPTLECDMQSIRLRMLGKSDGGSAFKKF